jgi:hypothetical protein
MGSAKLLAPRLLRQLSEFEPDIPQKVDDIGQQGVANKKHNEIIGSHDMIFSPSGFFHKSVSLGSLSIPLGPFRIFSKIRGNIRK